MVACCRVGGTECGSHYIHYFHHSLVSGQTTVRVHSPAHQQKIGLKIYRAWPHPSEQDPVSPSVTLSHQEASISPLSLSLEVRQNENHNHRKLIKLTTWTTVPFNSLSRVQLFATPWTAAHQDSLFNTNSESLLKLTSIESMMPSNHLILCCPLLPCPQSCPASVSFPLS